MRQAELGANGVEKGYGAVAQLGERLPCTQEVRSSILLGSTITEATDALSNSGESVIKDEPF